MWAMGDSGGSGLKWWGLGRAGSAASAGGRSSGPARAETSRAREGAASGWRAGREQRERLKEEQRALLGARLGGKRASWCLWQESGRGGQDALHSVRCCSQVRWIVNDCDVEQGPMKAVFHVEREAYRVPRIHRSVKVLEVPAFRRSGPRAPGPCPVPSTRSCPWSRAAPGACSSSFSRRCPSCGRTRAAVPRADVQDTGQNPSSLSRRCPSCGRLAAQGSEAGAHGRAALGERPERPRGA
jgi:hypothetical protein